MIKKIKITIALVVLFAIYVASALAMTYMETHFHFGKIAIVGIVTLDVIATIHVVIFSIDIAFETNTIKRMRRYLSSWRKRRRPPPGMAYRDPS